MVNAEGSSRLILSMLIPMEWGWGMSVVRLRKRMPIVSTPVQYPKRVRIHTASVITTMASNAPGSRRDTFGAPMMSRIDTTPMAVVVQSIVAK